MSSEKFTEAAKGRGNRKSVTMPTYAIWTTIVGSVGLGVLFGWCLFGRPHLINDFYRTGNLAEWIAAIATLVVGMGAWKYAREGHAHRLSEARRAAAEARQAKYARQGTMMTQLKRALAARTAITHFSGLKTEEQTTALLAFTSEVAIASLNGLTWRDADIDCLDDTLIDPFGNFEQARYLFVKHAESITKLMDTSVGTKLDEADRVGLKGLTEFIGNVVDAAQVLTTALKASRDAINPNASDSSDKVVRNPQGQH